MYIRQIRLTNALNGSEQQQQADQLQEEELLRARRRQEDIRRVRQTAMRSFSSPLLQGLAPRYEPGQGGFPPCMQFVCCGVPMKLNWGKFLWAEPGEEDYLEGRDADGTAVQFTPYSHGNDERLSQMINSYRRQRSWWRKFWDRT